MLSAISFLWFFKYSLTNFGASGAPHVRSRQRPRPMMACRAGLHGYKPSGMHLHEREELLARQLRAKHNLAARCRSVHLKDLPRQVNADDRDFDLRPVSSSSLR